MPPPRACSVTNCGNKGRPEAARYVPELEPGDFTRWYSGVRAQAVARDGRLIDDFVLSETERALHVRNAPSPAATSSFALARMIADRAEPGLR